MKGDYSTIQKWIDGLRQFSGDVRASAPALAEAIKVECVKAVSSGHSPDGEPFAPRKKDGGVPLRNAGAAITASTSGTVAIVQVTGPEALHHYGVNGAPPRHVVPVDDVPLTAAEAFRAGLIESFKKRLGV